MERKTSNIFVQFINAFYNFKAYPEFIRTHGGKVFLYSLLLTCVTYVCTFVVPLAEVMSYVYKVDTNTIDQYVPYFEISNGSLYIEEDLYYELEDVMLFYATSDFSIPADTAKDILRPYSQGYIISKDTLVLKQATGVIDSYSLSTIPDIQRDDLYDLIPIIKTVIVIIYVLVFIYYLCAYMFGTLVCSLIGQLANLVIKAPVTFGSVFKLTAYARTMPVICKMFFSLLNSLILHMSLPMFMSFILNNFVFYGLFLLYMIFALKAVKKENDEANSANGPGQVLPFPNQTAYIPEPPATIDSNQDDDHLPRNN